jgi:bidirectional [NiFe] hydrogenase diaphorase subunit
MLLEELKGIAEKQEAARKEICIRCCMASGCMSSQSAEIRDLLQKTVVEKKLVDRVEVGGSVAWDFAARAR